MMHSRRRGSAEDRDVAATRSDEGDRRVRRAGTRCGAPAPPARQCLRTARARRRCTRTRSGPTSRRWRTYDTRRCDASRSPDGAGAGAAPHDPDEVAEDPHCDPRDRTPRVGLDEHLVPVPAVLRAHPQTAGPRPRRAEVRRSCPPSSMSAAAGPPGDRSAPPACPRRCRSS